MSDPTLLRIPQAFHSIEEVLETAKRMNLTNVLVLSEQENGNLIWLECPNMTLAQANWLLDRFKMLLLEPWHDDETHI